MEQAPILKGVCRRYVGDIQLADDLVQNTFELAVCKIDSFKGNGSFNGWLRKIAVNQCLYHLREKKAELSKRLEFQESLKIEMEEDPMKYSSEDRGIFSQKELLNVIDSLPEKYRSVFNMYVLDGYKHHEIAEQLHISVGTSKSCLSRARKKAQEILIQKNSDSKQPQSFMRKSWILLLLFRFNVTDLIFKNALSNYSLTTGVMPSSLLMVGHSTLPIKAFIASKSILYGASVLLFVAASVITSSFFLKKDPEQQVELRSEITIPLMSSKCYHLEVEEPMLVLAEVPETIVVVKQKVITRKVYVTK